MLLVTAAFVASGFDAAHQTIKAAAAAVFVG